VTVADLDRGALRLALLAVHPWVAGTDVGPQAVSAGECDGCGQEARLVQPCGPPPPGVRSPDWALGRRCALAAGVDGWCGGHEDEADAVLRQLAALPAEADDVARLWWLATGEVRPDPTLVRAARALLPSATPAPASDPAP
jgi:hypothetical protein